MIIAIKVIINVIIAIKSLKNKAVFIMCTYYVHIKGDMHEFHDFLCI